MLISAGSLKSILQDLALHLEEQEHSATLICCGGAALIALSIISRASRDLDVLEPAIDSKLRIAAERTALKFDLDPEWLNNGPSSLISELPSDWRSKVLPIFQHRRLSVFSLSLRDLLFAKLWAQLDRGQDLSDILALNPTHADLDLAFEWVKEKDVHSGLNMPKRLSNILKRKLEGRNVSTDLATHELHSIGFSLFSFEPADSHADPESVIVRNLGLLSKDARLLSIFVDWLSEFEDLIHYERLEKILLRSVFEDNVKKAIAYATLGGSLLESTRLSSRGKAFVAKLKKRTSIKLVVVHTRNDNSKLFGFKKGFAEFGLSIPLENPERLFNRSQKRKIIPRARLLKTNIWLQSRSLFGCNYRADCFVARRLNAKNPTEVARLAVSSYETAHRNFYIYKELEELGLFQKSEFSA